MQTWCKLELAGLTLNGAADATSRVKWDKIGRLEVGVVGHASGGGLSMRMRGDCHGRGPGRARVVARKPIGMQAGGSSCEGTCCGSMVWAKGYRANQGL